MAHNKLEWLSYELRIPIPVLLELAENAERHYHQFEKRFANGKLRLIEAPDEDLATALLQIRRVLLDPIPFSPIVHGCVKERSPLTHAAVHVKTSNVASVDIKDFFPSVTNKMVYRVLLDRVNVGPDLARILTRVTTRRGHLPQGATTSPALANLVLGPVDREVERIAADLKVTAGRYVDNYDFAGVRAREAIGPAIVELQRAGFAVRHKKTFNAGPTSPHVVTGYTVNSSNASISRVSRDNVRLKVYGLIAAHERGGDVEQLQRSIRGHLVHLSLTNPGFVTRMRRQLASAGIVI
jgi:hypothetical protein